MTHDSVDTFWQLGMNVARSLALWNPSNQNQATITQPNFLDHFQPITACQGPEKGMAPCNTHSEAFSITHGSVRQLLTSLDGCQVSGLVVNVPRHVETS